MSSWFQSLSIAKKLNVGFNGLIAGMLVLSGIGVWVNLSSSAGLAEYRTLARNANAVGRVQANALATRLNVKDFALDHEEASAQAVRERAAKSVALAEEALELIEDPERHRAMEGVLTDVKAYAAAFDDAYAHTRAAAAPNAKLDELGPVLLDAFEASIDELAARSDLGSLEVVSSAMASAIRMRVDVFRFRMSLRDGCDEARRFGKATLNLLEDAPEPHRSTLRSLVADYLASVDASEPDMIEERRILAETLDVIGPRVAENTENLKLAYVELQDALGPRLVAQNNRMLVVVGVLSVVVLMLGVFVSRATIGAILKPIAGIVEAVQAMAQGDFGQRVEVHTRDEVGRLAEGFNRMAEDVSEVLSSIHQSTTNLGNSSQELSAVSEQLKGGSAKTASETTSAAVEMEQTSANLGTIASGSTQMSSNIQAVSAAAEEITATMESIAAAAEEVSQNMITVASAVEEMSASIQEVSHNAQSSSRITAEARDLASNASQAMGVLSENSDQIGKVTDVIKSIADQTNLLALNANIEAASAGAAGRGFAVVANEVKKLAQQSGKAAEDIASRITEVQGSTKTAADAMSRVAEYVERLAEAVDTIATSVEQQNTAAGQISQSVAHSSTGSQEIARNVAEVSSGIAQVSQSIQELNASSAEMSRSSTEAATSVTHVSSTIQLVRKVAEENDAGSQQVSVAASTLQSVAAELRQKVERFRFH